MIQGAVTPAETQAQSFDAQSFASLRLGDNEAARALLRSWMEDESDYDQRVWPQVQQLIEENRLSDRKRFAE